MQNKKPGRPKRAKLSDERILTCALALCAKSGVDGMTLRSLARELKVDPMAIYHYFPDRKTLLWAALAQTYRELPAEFTRTRDAAADTLEHLDAYRRISGRQIALMLYLLGLRNMHLPPLEAFNASLLANIERLCSSIEEAVLLRDLLIDYTHGYAVAAQHFTPTERRSAEKTYRTAVLRILSTAK